MNKPYICLGPPGWTVRVGYLYNEDTLYMSRSPQDGQYGLDIYIMNIPCICLGPPGWTVRVGYLYNE